MKKRIILLVCFPLFVSCEQIYKSINETFKPNDTITQKEKAIPETTVTIQSNVEQTTIETHSETHTHTEDKILDFLTNTNELEKAEQALRKLPQYAGKEIFVYSILYFYDYGTINIML